MTYQSRVFLIVLGGSLLLSACAAPSGQGVTWAQVTAQAVKLSGKPTATPSPAVEPTEQAVESTLEPTPDLYRPLPVSGDFNEAACRTFPDFRMPIERTMEDDVECGYLLVRESHALPDSRQIRLPVVIFKSYAEEPATPLVFAQGGPGASTIDTYGDLFLMGLGDSILETRDVILFDQRGTRHTYPDLMCPEMDDVIASRADEYQPPDVLQQMYIQAVADCHERLSRQPLSLSAYNSVENARDVEALRVALGYDQIDLYGVSYGTLLAQHVMRDYPDGLHSVILDAVVPLQVDIAPAVASNAQRSLNEVFAACAAYAPCAQAYPNLDEVFYQLVADLNENPATIPIIDYQTFETYETKLDGDTLVLAFQNLLYSAEVVPHIPRLIYDMHYGNFNLISTILYVYHVEVEQTFSVGMYYSVMCAEEGDFSADDQLLDGVNPAIANALDANEFLESCDLWDVQPLPPFTDEPLVSDVPVLVLSGGFDPITPPAWGQMVADNLENSYFYTFPSQSHGAFLFDWCATGIMMDFLDDPTTRPNDDCVEEVAEPNFVIINREITLIPFSYDFAGFGGVRPAEWLELFPGFWMRSLDDSVSLTQGVGYGSIDLDSYFSYFEVSQEEALIAQRQANGITWDIYSFQYLGQIIDLAVGEDGLSLIQLTAPPAERDYLYEDVFLPAVNAFHVIGE
jgi:pimeloyl-ACP methyl ester carboxylesterase